MIDSAEESLADASGCDGLPQKSPSLTLRVVMDSAEESLADASGYERSVGYEHRLGYLCERRGDRKIRSSGEGSVAWTQTGDNLQTGSSRRDEFAFDITDETD